MSRVNYTDEAAVPCSEVHRVPERVPFLLRDDTPLRRDKFCDHCGWGNRPVAMVCEGCGHAFPRRKIRRESDSASGLVWTLEILGHGWVFVPWA